MSSAGVGRDVGEGRGKIDPRDQNVIQARDQLRSHSWGVLNLWALSFIFVVYFVIFSISMACSELEDIVWLLVLHSRDFLTCFSGFTSAGVRTKVRQGPKLRGEKKKQNKKPNLSGFPAFMHLQPRLP